MRMERWERRNDPDGGRREWGGRESQAVGERHADKKRGRQGDSKKFLLRTLRTSAKSTEFTSPTLSLFFPLTLAIRVLDIHQTKCIQLAALSTSGSFLEECWYVRCGSILHP